MKRLVLSLVLLFGLIVPLWAAEVPGTATYTVNTYIIDGSRARVVVTIAWTTGDAGTGPTMTIVPATYRVEGYYLYSVETDPGSSAPTDNYDIVINDANGLDICWGLLADRDTTNTEIAFCATTGKGYPAVMGTLTPVVTNAGNTTTGQIILTFISN